MTDTPLPPQDDLSLPGEIYDPAVECKHCGRTIRPGRDGTVVLAECEGCLNRELDD
jgi:hypothetical protein